MKLLRKEPIHARYLISDPTTNLGRQFDSNPLSTDNKKNVASFLAYGGWSDDYPAVVGLMSGAWYFTIDAVSRGGCTAQEYVDRENTRRVALYNSIKASESSDKAMKLQAFEAFYYVNGQLEQLTLDNAVWVHSGHQRIQFVLFSAYLAWLSSGVVLEGMTPDELPPTKEFSLMIPCNVKEFDSLQEILTDQMSMNMGADIHNPLGILDLLKSAVMMLGRGFVPKYAEREFRRFCAEPGSLTEKGGSDGGYPRLAYLLAWINWVDRGILKFYDCLVCPEIIPHKDIKEGVKNEEWIDVTKFNAMNTDPRYNPSVIARLMESGLEKLQDYAKRYGPGSKFVLDGGENKLCAMEKVVLERGYCWTEEEKLAWVNSVKPYKNGYIAPVVKAKPPEFKIDGFKAFVNSTQPSMYGRALVAQLCNLNVPVPGPIQPVPMGIVERVGEQDREVLDTIYVLSPEGVDKTFRQTIVDLGHLREGNPDAFATIVQSIGLQIDAAIKSTVKSNSGESFIADAIPTVEGTAIDGNGNVVVSSETTKEEPKAVAERSKPKGKRAKS